MRKLLFIVWLNVVLLNQVNAQKMLPNEIKYAENTIILKLNERIAARGEDTNFLSIQSLISTNKVSSYNQVFPNKNTAQRGGEPSILSGIYFLNLTEGVNPLNLIAELESYANVLYAEREVLYELLYQPNDPAAQINAQQGYLQAIKAYDAWDIQRGDSSIIIGVIDTGTDLFHEDLNANLYINYADPINGIDDDGDGYVDNYYGWDFGDNNNDPSADGSSHGTRVAGVAAGVPDNSKGIAGVGFNSKYMPIKIFKTVGNTTFNALQSIVYAADMGCKVINLSWGAAGAFSNFGQDVINYAVLEKDAVVVAAAGNTSGELNFYPASFKNVLSVGAVDNAGIKPSWATISRFIDVAAPGVSIYTTSNNDQYAADSGTSLAAPMVAGTAALMRAQFTNLSALQIMHRIRLTSDNIYDKNAAEIKDMLGTGMLNMYRALAETNISALRLQSFEYNNSFAQQAFRGDTIRIKTSFINYLDAADLVSVKLETASPYVQWLKNEISLTNVGSMQQISSTQDFRFLLAENTPVNEKIRIKFVYEYTDRYDYEYIEIETNPEPITLTETDLHFTVNSSGGLALGKQSWLGNKTIKHSGWLWATAEDNFVHNTFIQHNDSYQTGQDFGFENGLQFKGNSIADFDLSNQVKISESASAILPLSFTQHFWHWKTHPQILLHEINVGNSDEQAILNLKVANLTDWELINDSTNNLTWSEELHLFVLKSSLSEISLGLYPLGANEKTAYAIDKKNKNGNTADFENALTNAEKFGFLINPEPKTSAGNMGAGNDVMSLLGFNIDSLAAFESKNVTIAFLFAENEPELSDLKNTADSLYNAFKLNPPKLTDLWACSGTEFSLEKEADFRIYDNPIGGEIIFEGNSYPMGVLENDTTIYIAKKNSAGIYTSIQQQKINTEEIGFEFSMDTEFLLIEEGGSGRVHFSDLSPNVSSRFWDFGNGFQSTNAQVSSPYSTAGIYTIRLTVTTESGCSETTEKSLEVALRNPRPAIESVSICPNQNAEISATNTNLIAVYSDEQRSDLLFEGDSFTTPQLSQAISYFITNKEGEYESLPTKVDINIHQGTADFDYEIDTLDLSNNIILNLRNKSTNDQQISWTINGENVGTENQININLSEIDELVVSLTIQTPQGCGITKTEEIPLQISPNPTFESKTACPGDEVLISPKEEGIYFFYSEQQAQTPIYKGRQLFIFELAEDALYFAQRVDKLIKSDLVAIPLEVSDLTITIETSSDTINLARESGIRQFSANRTNATQFLWTLSDSLQFESEEVQIMFTKTEVYQLKLETWDEIGCYAVTEKSIRVVDDILLAIDLEKGASKSKLWPNPSNGWLNLEINEGHSVSNLSIYSINGKLIHQLKPEFKESKMKIDLSTFADGSYILKVESINSIETHKFIIRK